MPSCNYVWLCRMGESFAVLLSSSSPPRLTPRAPPPVTLPPWSYVNSTDGRTPLHYALMAGPMGSRQAGWFPPPPPLSPPLSFTHVFTRAHTLTRGIVIEAKRKKFEESHGRALHAV